ncbi:hypothetical protein Atai01_39880 [Amycolatopsis taiwanensis]|uniref:Transglycosylase SLT domain-containing protein n=1 Tax=Amycolatopsis taiwanensis TaxID=342230 RepID=A0A9W6R0J4_9PSEU|nr:hypothetical protein Atai01_39880 [Amycolatopsis taiwanensis]
MVAAPGMPPEWADVEAKAQQVDKLNPAGIQSVADQFAQASKDSADHSVALRNATATLGGGTWSGPSADAFFDYVKKIGDAGQKVNDHLDEVSKELSTLQGSLSDIKNQIHTIQQQAKSQIDDANNQAVQQANAAEAQENAVHAGKEGAAMPSPTSAEIMAANAQKTSGIASGARDHIQTLLNNGNDQINRVMDLVKKDVEGGYDSVPPLGTAPSGAHSSGGLHGGGGSNFSGGGGGGGGGLGPSGGPPSGQPPGNVRQWIEEAIKEMQAQGIPVTEADINSIWAIIEHESGGNPHAINLWDCVPLDTMILTQRGWLKHNEVLVGDETIGYNPLSGHSEWTPITGVVHHENAPLVRLANSRWHATTTPNHRWLTLPRVHVQDTGLPTVCPECGWLPRTSVQPANGVAVHRRKMHGVVPPRQRNVHSDRPRFVTSKEVRSRDRILLSASARTPARLDITVREAAILAWIAGDGHVENRKHRPTMSIAQSKPHLVEKLKSLLVDVPHACYVDDQGGCGPRHQFRLDYDYSRDLIARAGSPKSDSVAQVLAMSTEQREAWLEALTDAEGARTLKPGYSKAQVAIYQSPGAVLEAATLAVYLSGRRPRVLHARSRRDTWQPEASVRGNTPVVSGASLGSTAAGRGNVWCVTTGLGTWTAREEDHVFLTGNSNAKAGHPSKGLMQTIDSTFNSYKLPGHGDIYNPVDNIIAGVRYTMSRYGSIANTPGLKAMSHGGGYVGY